MMSFPTLKKHKISLKKAKKHPSLFLSSFMVVNEKSCLTLTPEGL
jgi:hypothetical protein